MTLYFNASEGPIVINDEGVSIGGGEWFETELTDQIRAAISRNEVVRINSNVAEKFDNVPVTYSNDSNEDDTE